MTNKYDIDVYNNSGFRAIDRENTVKALIEFLNKNNVSELEKEAIGPFTRISYIGDKIDNEELLKYESDGYIGKYNVRMSRFAPKDPAKIYINNIK